MPQPPPTTLATPAAACFLPHRLVFEGDSRPALRRISPRSALSPRLGRTGLHPTSPLGLGRATARCYGISFHYCRRVLAGPPAPDVRRGGKRGHHVREPTRGAGPPDDDCRVQPERQSPHRASWKRQHKAHANTGRPTPTLQRERRKLLTFRCRERPGRRGSRERATPCRTASAGSGCARLGLRAASLRPPHSRT